jgi:type IV secretion system protein TrbL
MHAHPSLAFDAASLSLFDAQQVRARARNVRAGLVAFVVTYALLAWMGGARAQGFDAVLGIVQGQSDTWLQNLAKTGQSAFIALAGLEIAWCALLWAFEKDSMNSIVGDLVKSVMTISFFYAVMTNAHYWIPLIHQQFSTAAGTLESKDLTVDGVVGQGLKAYLFIYFNMLDPVQIFAGVITQMVTLITNIIKMMGTLGTSTIVTGGDDLIVPLVEIGMTLLWGFTSWAVGGTVALCVLIAYLVIALQLVMLQVEMALLMAAGAIFLGLGGSRWTRDYVQKYLNHALVTGFRYLVLMMVLSFTVAGADAAPWEARWDAMQSSYLALGGHTDLTAAQSAMASTFAMLFLALVKVFLAIKAPDLAGALFSGGAALTANAVGDTVMTMANAATTALGAPGAVVGAAEAAGKLAAVGIKGAAKSAGIQAAEHLKPKSPESVKPL